MAGLQKGTEFKAPEKLDYEVGDRVRHIKYGEGTVLNIVREPRDYKVTVEFDQAGAEDYVCVFCKTKAVVRNYKNIRIRNVFPQIWFFYSIFDENMVSYKGMKTKCFASINTNRCRKGR